MLGLRLAIKKACDLNRRDAMLRVSPVFINNDKYLETTCVLPAVDGEDTGYF